MTNRSPKSGQWCGFFAISVLALFIGLPTPLHAQSFQPVPGLAFTKVFAGAEPLPQVLTIAYTDQSSVRFSATASTNSGGSWLSLSPSGNGCCFTPLAVSVIVNAGNLAAGTYTGQVVITNYTDHNINMTIAVTLFVKAASDTFFDDLPGKLSFSFKTGGTPISQSIQIRNAGTGTLNWTLSPSTADGGNWLTSSTSDGTAPSTISISINKAALPGGGATAGTFVGQLLFQTPGDSVTIPVAVTVGDPVITQVNPLNFTMAFGGANPLAQVINIALTDNTAMRYSVSVANAKGGNWLSISPSGNGCCFTPLAHAVSVNAGSIPAGVYTAEIILKEYTNPGRAMVVPVTLTVVASGAFFADLPGQLSFSVKTNGTTATSQTVQVANGGTGTLNWTVTSTTADGGNWLSASTTSTTASIAVNVSRLPGGGVVEGEYLGQLVFQTTGDTTTIPVTVTVGAAAFTQLNPLSFTMPFGGANPLPQIINVVTIDNSRARFSASVATGKGGDWLSVSPSGNGCCFTPLALGARVNAPSLPVGIYTGEIIITEYTNPGRSMVVPVNLTVVAGGPFFDTLPGGLSFSVATGGSSTTPQIVQIGNGGSGTLNWTANTTTADGGAWLTASPVSGTAPSLATISVNPANLPSGGALAGTFIGQVVFQTAGDITTIPVTVTVGTAVFEQLNQISFTMPTGGSNPLPQILNIAATDGSAIRFSASTATSRGGSWLSISPSGNGCCFTPLALTASIDGSGLTAGTYTGEIIITEYANPGRSMTVPVTLTVSSGGAFFDSLPGGLSFSVTPEQQATPQTLLVGNGGTGQLQFTVTPTTSDGGAWLTTTPLNGTAPTTLTVSVNVANLPGGGVLPGTFNGQLLLEAPGSIATVPITVTVGSSVFSQVNPISFVIPFGGPNPLPQVLSIASSDSSAIRFSASAATGKGGNWLSIAPSGNGCCFTQLPVRVSIDASSLAIGQYTGEINIIEYANPGRSMTVPINLTVVAAHSAFFDNLPGQTSFSFTQGTGNPPSQTIQIDNGGTDTLHWTETTSTADGGAWLTATPGSGTAPQTVTISVTAANLPGGGALAGTFVGQQLLTAATGNVTIPVVVTVGDPVFVQLPTLTFSTMAGVNPAPQIISIASTSGRLRFTPIAATGKGGNWLSISPSGNGCCFTPTSETVTLNAIALSPGTYIGEINVIEYANPGQSMTVPVVLTVTPIPLVPTTTVLVTSPNPSNVGQSVTMTATVTAQDGSTPSGTVVFTSNSAQIGSASLNNSGVAVLHYAGLPAGTDHVVAMYQGSTTLAGSTSNSVSQVVHAVGSTTAVSSSPNPSNFGESVTITAAVSPLGPPAPTGTVGFTSNGSAISGCTAVGLSSGTAVCETSSLATGTDAIVATYSGDGNYGGSSGSLTQIVNPVPSPVQFVAVTPCRVVDTRNPNGTFGGPAINGHSSRNFPLSQSGNPCSIPSNAVAYSLNVTVIPSGRLGYLTIWPSDQGQPSVSLMNSLDGRVKANAAIIPAGTSHGSVSVYVTDTTNVVLDIDGYFTASTDSTLEFYPLTPCRVVDTRNPNGHLGGPFLSQGAERDFPVQESSCIPHGVTPAAYSFNITVAPHPAGQRLGFLTVWPAGEQQPTVSTLNNPTGTNVANAAIVPAGSNGAIAVYPNNTTDLIVDINGYFAAPGSGGLSLYTLTPCRVLDTRNLGNGNPFQGELTVNVVDSACGPPTTAQAFVFNATVVPPGHLGYLTLWPDGEDQPVVSTLNATDGAITSNMAIVPTNNGSIDAYASALTQLILDISSYFAP